MPFSYKVFERKDHTYVQIKWIMVMKLFIKTRKSQKKNSFDIMINSYEYIYKWSCVRNKFDCRQGNKDGFFFN